MSDAHRPPRRPISLTLLFGALAIALAYVLVELLAFFAYAVIESRTFSLADVTERRRTLVAEATPDAAKPAASKAKYVPHPYLGYVLNPERFPGRADWWIHGEGDPFHSPPDAVHVVLVGGSVALNLRANGEQLLAALRDAPGYETRPLRLFTLAGLGYKQPQQLLAAAYFLAQGGRIDVLVNLDGFNEIGSEVDRNLRQGVHPAYPSFWSQATRDLRNASDLGTLGEIVVLQRSRATLASAFEPVRLSVAANLAWLLLDRGLERQMHERAGASLESEDSPVYSRGPAYAEGDREAHEFAVDVWRESSLALHALARGSGFAYFHFLQPNQYVPDSKRAFTTLERNKFLGREQFDRAVRRWYPELQTAGEALRSKGVAFFDETRIFLDMEDTAYSDACCHLSAAGRALLAESIGKTIARHLADAAGVRPPADSSAGPSSTP